MIHVTLSEIRFGFSAYDKTETGQFSIGTNFLSILCIVKRGDKILSEFGFWHCKVTLLIWLALKKAGALIRL